MAKARRSMAVGVPMRRSRLLAACRQDNRRPQQRNLVQLRTALPAKLGLRSLRPLQIRPTTIRESHSQRNRGAKGRSPALIVIHERMLVNGGGPP